MSVSYQKMYILFISMQTFGIMGGLYAAVSCFMLRLRQKQDGKKKIKIKIKITHFLSFSFFTGIYSISLYLLFINYFSIIYSIINSIIQHGMVPLLAVRLAWRSVGLQVRRVHFKVAPCWELFLTF